jgi:hypothetical protein
MVVAGGMSDLKFQISDRVKASSSSWFDSLLEPLMELFYRHAT